MRLTPSQRGCLTRVVDTTLDGRPIVSGHERTIQSLMRLGLATYPPSGMPYRAFGPNSQWRHAILTPLGATAAADLGWTEEDDDA